MVAETIPPLSLGHLAIPLDEPESGESCVRLARQLAGTRARPVAQATASASPMMSIVRRSVGLSHCPSMNCRKSLPTSTAFSVDVDASITYSRRSPISSMSGSSPSLARHASRSWSVDSPNPSTVALSLRANNASDGAGTPPDAKQRLHQRHLIEDSAREEDIDGTVGQVDSCVSHGVVGRHRSHCSLTDARSVVVPLIAPHATREVRGTTPSLSANGKRGNLSNAGSSSRAKGPTKQFGVCAAAYVSLAGCCYVGRVSVECAIAAVRRCPIPRPLPRSSAPADRPIGDAMWSCRGVVSLLALVRSSGSGEARGC